MKFLLTIAIIAIIAIGVNAQARKLSPFQQCNEWFVRL